MSITTGSGTNDPSSPTAAAQIIVAYNQWHNEVYADLTAQTALQPLFAHIKTSVNALSGTTSYDFSAVETTILADLASNRAAALTTLSDFNESVQAEGLDTTAGYATFRTALIAQGTDIAATFPYGTSVRQRR